MPTRILFYLFLSFSIFKVSAQVTIPLYTGKIPGNLPKIENTERVQSAGSNAELAFSVSEPSLTIYKPVQKDARNIGIIICPGGGYYVLATEKEGKAIAKVFNDMGITAFLLKYRIPDNKKNIDKSLVPLMDAQRAMQLVRKNAKTWDIDPHKIGIIGFSAGGHLAATASTQFNKETISNAENISLRPDFSILAYSVISFADAYTHVGSKENLLKGAALHNNKFYKNYEEAAKFFSPELNITAETPPTFLFHTMSDSVVKAENTIRYFNGLLQKKVANCELIIYPTGKHGIGLHLPQKGEYWPERIHSWLQILYP